MSILYILFAQYITSSSYRYTLFLCKQIGTGFKEEDLENHTKFFKDHVISQTKSYYRFDSSHEPDHWFEPIQVWEIKCADLSLSPVHRAAIGIVSFLNLQRQIFIKTLITLKEIHIDVIIYFVPGNLLFASNNLH